MPKRVGPLNAKQIEKWRPDPSRILELVDGAVPGLRVRLTPNGTMTWSLLVRVNEAWIPERSATRLREADLDIFSKLGKQGLEWRLEPEAFAGREVGRQDDLLDVLVGCPVDIQVARLPST